MEHACVQRLCQAVGIARGVGRRTESACAVQCAERQSAWGYRVGVDDEEGCVQQEKKEKKMEKSEGD